MRTCARRSSARPRSPRPLLTEDEPEAEAEPLTAATSVIVDERLPLSPPSPRLPPRASTPAPLPPRWRGRPEGKLDDAEIEALIVQLAAESPDPVSGLVSRLPESQGMRVMLALMVGGGLATLLVGLSYLLGLFVN